MADNSFINIPSRLRVYTEQWNFILKQALYDLRVALPGIIQDFDAEKQTASVIPAIRENLLVNLVPTPVDMPVLIHVPIVIPRAGKFSLTMPVQPGDECLVIFADMDYAAWWQSGGKDANGNPQRQNQIDKRRHDLSDGFAILGCWSQPRVLSNYSTEAAELRNEDGTVTISVKDNEIDIKAPNVKIEGNLEVTGTSKFDQNITIDGHDFDLHKHTGVTTGGGTSGPVAP